MGRPVTSILADLPPDDRALIDAFAAALHAAGYFPTVFPSRVGQMSVPEATRASTHGNFLRAARRFLTQTGLVGWRALSLDAQLAVLTRSRPTTAAQGTRFFLC